ncbi:hypothetical protein H310_14322 [Aphanomyces invadans]|uniref:Uncharacterized protein n=1 Tax=Aphanomyces invadans TaxID=157072 RepID=A0A024TA23_9STRA|nr:hypothetical protein H310_14322 [Aphanomyces invadans]ETV90985.1 hypothetical protein H310_14322 [Aphanomyces invadans]|eukprot:XP_008880374.1 hypothetical protein H310_14322 [Aphanomyces invadans]
MTQWTESHAGAQAELARVRAEGDWIMIKIEMEKKELDATLKEIEMAKAQIAALHTTKLHECPTAVTAMDLAKHVKALQTQQERYKGHVSEDLSKLALLRQAVDEARRVRKDALAAEADEQCRAKHMAGTIAATHAEIASIKQREAVMADQIRQVQADIDSDQAAFFAARKELADQLHECHKHQAKHPNERSHVQAIAGVSSAAHTYKKKSNLSWLRARNKVCLVKRTESLEKKKDLLDALLDTSKLPTVHCFLDKYLRQEADKAVMCVEIDRQSTINAAILVNIQRLEAEKTQSRDMHTMDGLNPYCQDIRNQARKSREHTEKLRADTKQFESLAKRLFEPLEQLFVLTCGASSTREPPDPSIGVKMHLERLARIEEHVAQKVLSKIAHECATHNGHWQQSATLVRLLQSRGVLRPKLVQFPPPLPTSVAPVAVGPTRPSDDRDNDQDDEHDANHTDRPDHAIQRDAIVAVNSKDVLRELRECHAARALTLDDDGARHSLCKSKSRRRLSAADVRRDESIAALTTRARFPGTKLARAVADVELDCTSVMIAASSAEPKERRRSSTSVASTS